MKKWIRQFNDWAHKKSPFLYVTALVAIGTVIGSLGATVILNWVI